MTTEREPQSADERRTQPRRWSLAALISLLLIIGVAAVIRISAMGWAVELGPKAAPEVPRTDESTFLGHFKNYPDYNNVYVPQASVHALLAFPIAQRIARIFDPKQITTDFFIFQVGRFTSMLASFGFLLLVFFGGRAFGLETRFQRVLAIGLLAFSPVLSVYGHLFLADSPNLLWIYLSFWAFIRFTEKHEDRYAVLFALCAGFAGSTKFATTYCVIPGLAMLLVAPRPVSCAFMMAFVSIGAFWAGTGFTYDMGKLKWAYESLFDVRGGNKIVIDVSINLVNQAAFFVAALGIPTVLLTLGAFVRGLWRRLVAVPARLGRAVALVSDVRISGLADVLVRPSIVRRRLVDWMARNNLTIVILSLLFQFLLFATSGIGGFFIRHVIPFLPVLIFAAVRLCGDLPGMQRRAVQVAVAVLLLGYQIVFCLDAERGYLDDPRQQARDWLVENRPPKVWAFHDPYAFLVVKGLPMVTGQQHLGPSPMPRLSGDHMVVTHQALFGRYFLAESCKKIQHCFGGEIARRFYIDLVQGRSKGYRLVHDASPSYFMPEHKLLGRVVPTHPYPEVGRVMVFRKISSAN